jgi:uncharacterized protein (DUF2147 family)
MEVVMRVLMAIAAVLLATSAARAQYSFEYNGQTIRIDPDRGTVSIPGVFDNTAKKSRRVRTDQDSTRKPTKVDPQTLPEQPTAPAAQAPAPAAPTPSANGPAPNTPAAATAAAPLAAPAPQQQPQSQQEAKAPAPSVAGAPALAAPNPPATTPAPNPKPADSVAAVPPARPMPAPAPQTQAPTAAAAAAPARDLNSPVGVWLTEEKEGKVRIEPCGANLCGYSVDEKSNQNGEQVLINMKPGKDRKWSGRIVDPNTGSSYDSTIALTGTNALRVQGCAFGGMFCGGQTWTRVN